MIKVKSIVTLIVVTVLFLSCRDNNLKTIKAFSHPPGAPEVVMDSMVLFHSDSAIVRFKLITPKLKVFEDENEPYTEFPDGFEIQQFNKQKEVTSNIYADYGIYYDNKGVWEARHNVVAITYAGDTLFTEELFWDEEKDIIYSEQFVKIINKEKTITGIGFESDLQMSEYFIKNVTNSHITIEVEEHE